MLRSSSFDFEAQFHHAQEGYSDSSLHIDSHATMDRRLQRKIVGCQKRFHRYRSRTPPSPPTPLHHSHAARKTFIANIPHAFKTFITRSPSARSHSHIPRRLNRLHGADNSRMSVLTPSLRKEFRRISYHTPQSSRVLVNLDSPTVSDSPLKHTSRGHIAHKQHQPPPDSQTHIHPLPRSKAEPYHIPKSQSHLEPKSDSHLRLESKPISSCQPRHSIEQNQPMELPGLAPQNSVHQRSTPILSSGEIPSAPLIQKERAPLKLQDSPSKPSEFENEPLIPINPPVEQITPHLHSHHPPKPSEQLLDVSTLINKYDKDNCSSECPTHAGKRPSLIPEAQHKFATMRALFESRPTEHHRPTSLKSPPRSHTAPFLTSKPHHVFSPPSAEQTSMSSLSRTTSPKSAMRADPEQFSKRNGTRYVKPAVSPRSPLHRRSIRTEGSITSSVTKSPDDDTLLGDTDLECEHVGSSPLFQDADKRDVPERMNLKDLFDSLELSPDKEQKSNSRSPRPGKVREASSTVAKLIARYGGTGEVSDQKNVLGQESEPSATREEKPRVERNVYSVVLEEDEIEKVYPTTTKEDKKKGDSAVQLSERKGGVEAIPWEARIKSVNKEVPEAASMAHIRKVKSHDGDNHRFKSFSLYSGTDQDSKFRTRSEGSGRRWRKRNARAQNKSWLSRKAHEQMHKVRKHVVTVKNIMSADDY